MKRNTIAVLNFRWSRNWSGMWPPPPPRLNLLPLALLLPPCSYWRKEKEEKQQPCYNISMLLFWTKVNFHTTPFLVGKFLGRRYVLYVSKYGTLHPCSRTYIHFPLTWSCSELFLTRDQLFQPSYPMLTFSVLLPLVCVWGQFLFISATGFRKSFQISTFSFSVYHCEVWDNYFPFLPFLFASRLENW